MPLAIPSTMPMGSGAPLGGIGTGFVEIRADGCFHRVADLQLRRLGAKCALDHCAACCRSPISAFLAARPEGLRDSAQMRRLYLRADENNLYTLPFVQDIESIDYSAWFPMTGLRYNDSTLPVHASAQVFSPFIPGLARDSATPGFHVVYTLENTCDEPVDVSLAGFLDNPLASALPDRRLTNSLTQEDGVTSIPS